MALEDLWLEIALFQPGRDEPQTWRRSFRSVNGEKGLTVESVARRIVLNVNFGPLAEAAFLDRLLGYHVEGLKLTIQQHIEAQDTSSSPLVNGASADAGIDTSYFDSVSVIGPNFTRILARREHDSPIASPPPALGVEPPRLQHPIHGAGGSSRTRPDTSAHHCSSSDEWPGLTDAARSWRNRLSARARGRRQAARAEERLRP